MNVQRNKVVLYDKEIYNFFAGFGEFTYESVKATQTNLYDFKQSLFEV